MAWTKQQQNAIELRNASVIVSAAAGSGKTAVLTERLAQILSDESAQVRADKIIVVTFTNDAASELRKRLDHKLRHLISQNPENSYLIRQQALLQGAKISTINSFCFELLRDNISEQGITSSFNILDESENEIIKAQAMDKLINFFSSKEYDKISFMYDKFCLRNDKNLIDVINLIDRYLSSSAMHDRWLSDAIKIFDMPASESTYFAALAKSAQKKLDKAMRLANHRLDMMENIFDDLQKPSAVKYCTQAEDDLIRIEKAVKIIESRHIPDNEEIAYCTDFGRIATVRRTDEINIPLLEFCNAKRRLIVKEVSSALLSFINFEEDYEESRQVTEILAEMIKKYHSLVWEKKCEKNAISFDDGERLVLEILSDTDEKGNPIQSETAMRIAEFYDIIMIDEYQDSNNKQDLIFKLISKNYHIDKNGTPIYGNNAFLVGDVKQSIYKFRLANPQNFIGTIKNSLLYSQDVVSDNYSIFLNKNFRSSHEVIDFINFVFSRLMSENCGDVEYDENEQLHFGATEYETSHSDTECITHIAFINSEVDSEENDEKESITNISNPEAVYTAKKIYSMLNEKAKVILKDGSSRQCEPSDFCILIRKNKFTKDYVSELKKLGIDARGEEEKGYLSSREIAVLLDLLRIIDNPLLDVPMAAVMMSPMYMFEFEEIAYLKTFGKNSHIFTILNEVINHKYSECNDVFFIERCNKFLTDLGRFRLLSVTMTVGELISEIYDDTDFISVMQLYTDGEKKRANLRALIQYANNYEKASLYEGSGGLSGFVRYINRITEDGLDFPQGSISSSAGNYVSIKTIHKSKGLEYPFVFLAETSSIIQNDTPPVICSDDGRIGFVLYDQKLVRRYHTSFYNQIIEENNRNVLSEEMRLLYVAMTRAKQKLFINMKYNKRKIKSLEKMIDSYYMEEENLKELAVQAKCHADWIWMALLEHYQFTEIAENIGLEKDESVIPASSISAKLFDCEFVQASSLIDKPEEKNEFKEIVPDSKIYSELQEIINYNYDLRLSDTPSKMSVTQITKKFKGTEDNIDFKLKRPRFTLEDLNLTGAERGTAIHTFFQYCDFEEARNNPESEILRMIEKGYLNKNQADSIDRINVAAFFKSNLYSRIFRSQKVYREKKFMVALADLNIENSLMESLKKSDGMIKGIVDLAFEENNKLIVVDYKSDRGVSSETLRDRYNIQLHLYKSALEVIMGMDVSEMYLYSFELKDSIIIDL